MIPRALPIRWKLTIWYVSLLGVVLVLFSGSLYFGLRYYLYRSLDNTLENQAALLIESVDVEDGEAKIGDRGIRTRPGRQFIRLVDQDRELLTDSSLSHQNIPVENAGISAALNGRDDYRWFEIDGRRLRVLSQPIEADGEVIAAVQVGVSDRAIGAILYQMLVLIMVTGVVVLGIVSAGGVWLAGRALTPIDRMTRLAGRIGNQNLSRRIELPRSDDEVGRLARTFNAMLDRLEELLHRQRQFTAAASHELRTPLALMQSQIELALSQERKSDSDTEVLKSLQTDVSRLTRITNMLLALARSDSGEMRLTYDIVELQSLLELLAEQYAPLADASAVQIRVEAEPVRLLADEDRLIQLLVNLLDNAFTHSKAGKTITLRCTADKQTALVAVCDQGAGIEPEHLPHIFERFYRTEASRGYADGGVGLGLTISKMIVDAHRGSIDVRSQPGEGTEVTVKLPNAGAAWVGGIGEYPLVRATDT